jgi:tight adherence protein C
MNNTMLVVFLIFISSFLLVVAFDLLRGNKSILGKYIDKSNNIYEFAENISSFIPNFADDIRKEELNSKLLWSGDILGVSVEGYYALRLVLGLIGLSFGLMLYPLGITLIFGVLAGILFSLIPLLYLRSSIEKRQTEITMALPHTVNLLSTAIGAGIELGPALEAISHNTRGSLGEVLRNAWREIATGKSRAEALKTASRNTGVQPFERFVDTIVVAEERGGMELSKSLNDFSLDMRHMERKFLEERAKKVPTKMLLPIMVCIFIPMLLLLLAPVILSVFRVL